MYVANVSHLLLCTAPTAEIKCQCRHGDRTALVATLLASASASPRINTDDNNIRMEVDSGKDIE